jgi:hypothetical protein
MSCEGTRSPYPRIVRIISLTFGVDVDKNVVYRVLSKQYRPGSERNGTCQPRA